MKFYVHQKWYPFFKKNKKELKTIIKQIDFNNPKKKILPPQEQIFRTFEYFGPKECKLCLLGQDPYPGQDRKSGDYYAEGLSFSANPNIKNIPMSLANIFKELKNNYPDFKYENGSLIKWVKNEKILLLNTALTVVEGNSNSHSSKWENFTDNVIRELDKNSDCLFLLMGGNAKKKMELIKNNKRIITCVHPSPLSCNKGFFNSEVFKKINTKLIENNKIAIDWNLL